MANAPIPNRVFVYGTLMPGRPNAHVVQALGGVVTARATVHGFVLYHLEPEGYPAIVPGDGAVDGVVFTFDAIETALSRLDVLEGCDRTPPLYVREVQPTERVGTAWVYIYNRPERLKRPGAVRVPSGMWTPP